MKDSNVTKTTKHFRLKIKTKTKSKMPARINTVCILSLPRHGQTLVFGMGWDAIHLHGLKIICTKAVEDQYLMARFHRAVRVRTVRYGSGPNKMI